MKLECIKCGKRESVSMGLCQPCLEDVADLRASTPISVVTCRKCNSLFVGKRWLHNWRLSDLDSLARQSVSYNESKVSLKQISLNQLEMEKEEATASVILETNDSYSYGSSIKFKVARGSRSCDLCNRKSGSSYEAIVQLRSVSESTTEDFTKTLNEIVSASRKRATEKNSNYILKEQHVPGGLDIYLGSKSFAEQIVSFSTSKFFCTVTRTKKRYGRKEGYDTYRYTYLVRLFDLQRGDVIYLNDIEYIVGAISSTSIVIISTDRSRPEEISKKQFLRYRVKLSRYKPEFEKFTLLSRKGDEATLMGESGLTLVMKGIPEKKVTVNLLRFKERYYYIN